MAYGKDWYERRKEITDNRPTGEICAECKLKIMVDKTVDLRFCGCGYHQNENQAGRAA